MQTGNIENGSGNGAAVGRLAAVVGFLAGTFGLLAVALGLLTVVLGLPGCAIRESGSNPADDDGGGSGLVITVKDSAKVTLDFGDTATRVFSDSAEFNLVSLRKKLNDKDIDPAFVDLIGIQVTYDSSTRQFLSDNQDIRFILRIYTRNAEDTGKGLLTLETIVDEDDDAMARLDPDQLLFKLNQDLFGNAEGFPFLLGVIEDESVERILVRAELELVDKLKVPGELHLNMVVDVAGKV